MKGLQNTNYDYFLQTVLGGKANLDDARERLGDRVFEEWLIDDPTYDEVVGSLHDIAIATGTRRSSKNQGMRVSWEQALALVPRVKRNDPDFAAAMDGLVHQDLQRMVAFEIAGRQTYRFSKSLSGRLLRTSIDVPAELFKLPHKSFQTVHDAEEAIQLFCTTLALLRPRLRIPAGTRLSGSSLSISVTEIDEGLDGDRELVLSVMMFLPPGGRITVRSLMLRLPRGDDTGKRLPELISSQTMKLPDDYRDPDTSDPSAFAETVTSLLQLAANSALYLISSNADIGQRENPYKDLKRKASASGLPAKQRKRAASQLRETSQTAFREVGKSLESVKFSDAAKTSAVGDGSKWKLQKKLVVSGHYKVQRFGKQFAESKIIFVEPYDKGPDAADVVAGNFYVPDRERKIITEDDLGDEQE